MLLAPIPRNDEDRLAALRALDILDSDFEPVYDAIVQLAAVLCDVPISSITMIDRGRQWHKAMLNIADRQAPREITFCAHTILYESGLVVEDAAADDRFRDNPLVAGAPHIRFYAGQRLTTQNGHAVGTLCVIDRRPRKLTERQLDSLRLLALQASALLELRLCTQELRSEAAERRRAEALAHAARRVADEANRAKSTFLARMSHELRTPLNAVIGFSRLLLKNRDGRLAEPTLQFVSRIEANGHHLLRLIDDILDLTKIESGRVSANRASVDVSTLVSETVDELQGRLRAGGESSRVALVIRVPERSNPISTDPLRLKQIVINLVGNALKFTEQGRVLVRVIADASGDPLRIDVVDSGIGIPSDRIAAVFEAFEQAAPDTASRYGGTGLGLAISRALADLLGYRITAVSTPGEGSTFSIVLRD
jgi:signal transduction histidine kinase